MFIADASIALAWMLDDERTDDTLRLLESLDRDRIVVPHVFWAEVANALLVASRRQRLVVPPVHIIERLRRLPISVDAESAAGTIAEALRLAELHGLTAYDATYLELATRLSAPLATLDRSLRDAARRGKVSLA